MADQLRACVFSRETSYLWDEGMQPVPEGRPSSWVGEEGEGEGEGEGGRYY